MTMLNLKRKSWNRKKVWASIGVESDEIMPMRHHRRLR